MFLKLSKGLLFYPILLCYCVVFLGDSRYSHSASLYPGVLRHIVGETEWNAEITLASNPGGSINTPTSRYILRKPGYGLAGWAIWLQYRLYLSCLSYHLLSRVYGDPNSWAKQTNVEGIPIKCSNSRITVEALATNRLCILHFDKKAHSKFRETRRGGVSYAGVALFARLSKDHSVSCRKQQNTIFLPPASLKWQSDS